MIASRRRARVFQTVAFGKLPGIYRVGLLLNLGYVIGDCAGFLSACVPYFHPSRLTVASNTATGGPIFKSSGRNNADAKEIGRQYKKLGIEILTSTKVETIIDDNMRTNVPHLYAIGDVTAKLQLAHVAEAQRVVAAETIAGAETMTLDDHRMMPRATFGQPQVASFGLTKQQAREEGYDVKVAKFPFTANGKAHGLGEPRGFRKLIADSIHGELLGANMIGADAAGEALQESVHGLLGHSINL